MLDSPRIATVIGAAVPRRGAEAGVTHPAIAHRKAAIPASDLALMTSTTRRRPPVASANLIYSAETTKRTPKKSSTSAGGIV